MYLTRTQKKTTTQVAVRVDEHEPLAAALEQDRFALQRLTDRLEEEGVIGPADHAGLREIC
jgi:hypothetical protein